MGESATLGTTLLGAEVFPFTDAPFSMWTLTDPTPPAATTGSMGVWKLRVTVGRLLPVLAAPPSPYPKGLSCPSARCRVVPLKGVCFLPSNFCGNRVVCVFAHSHEPGAPTPHPGAPPRGAGGG